MTTALGIDIGGTGIKGGRVDLLTGMLVSERIKYPTPEGGSPDDTLEIVQRIVRELDPAPEEPLGICFPGVVTHGVTRSAANVSSLWVDLPATDMFSKALGRDVHFVNDADGAGVAEARFGAAAGIPGLVIVLTLGTGIGSAFLLDGVLVPNTELGHLEIDGEDAEARASNAARKREELDFPTWAARLTRMLTHLEKVFTPDLFLIGGGVSQDAESFLPLITIKTPLRAAGLRNNAGIIGAAYLAGQSLLD